MTYLSTACSVSLKDLRNLDKRRTKAEVAGRKKKLSVIHEQYLKVVSLRNKKKSSKDVTQVLRDASGPDNSSVDPSTF